MADIIDEHGNPIQLTDEHGRQVQLTDEHGVPVHLTGVATTIDSGHHVGTEGGFEQNMHGLAHVPPPNQPVMNPVEPVTGGAGVGVGVGSAVPSGGPLPCHPGTGGIPGEKQHQLGRPGSSSSSSSEDDGAGGRRKKKGLMQKIKEKLPGHKNKEPQVPEKVYTATTKVSVTTPAGPLGVPKPEYIQVEHHEEEHEKKSLMDKIKDKLPGHHSHTN